MNIPALDTLAALATLLAGTTPATIPADTVRPGDLISYAGIVPPSLVVSTVKHQQYLAARTADGWTLNLPLVASITLHRGARTAAALILANAPAGAALAAVRRGLPLTDGEQRAALLLARVQLRNGQTAAARMTLTRWAMARVTA